MYTLLDVKKRARSLIGDPDGDFCTDSYILPLINQAYDDSLNYLLQTCSPFVTQLVVCPDVAEGTSTLQPLQAGSGYGNPPGGPGPLYALVNPLKIEFKQAGFPEASYRFAERYDILPNLAPDNAPPTRGLAWEWRSYILYLTPLPFPADLRVRGEFRPSELIKDTDPINLHPLMCAALSYATGALIGVERANQNYIQNYGPRAIAALDDIAAELVRTTQSTTSRVGRMNRGARGTRRWF